MPECVLRIPTAWRLFTLLTWYIPHWTSSCLCGCTPTTFLNPCCAFNKLVLYFKQGEPTHSTCFGYKSQLIFYLRCYVLKDLMVERQRKRQLILQKNPSRKIYCEHTVHFKAQSSKTTTEPTISQQAGNEWQTGCVITCLKLKGIKCLSLGLQNFNLWLKTNHDQLKTHAQKCVPKSGNKDRFKQTKH